MSTNGKFPPARAAIISAIYGDYEDLKPALPQTGLRVEWVLVTDNRDMAKNALDMGWDRTHYEPKPTLHPNRAAKRPKMLPWEFTKAGCSVWIDGAFLVKSPTFAVDVLAAAFPTGIAQFRHPWRDCAYAEGKESMRIPRYQDEVGPIRDQLAENMAGGLPEHWGLWATGCIARHHTQQVRHFGELWHWYISDFTYQDQVSETLALFKAEIRPRDLAGTHLSNPWLEHRQSARHL
jgi:hypothetical protein